MRSHFLVGLLSGVVGGLTSAYLVGHLGAAAATREDVVSAHRIQLVDSAGRTRALLAMSPDGGPGLFFYDTSGRNRLVLGLYAPAESEYPFVVLNDGQQQAAGIFRLFGAKETPVVVLKNKGRDRSIYGLNPGSTEPFLANYANDGTKTSAFGNY
jgi:hypothetical protein